MKKVLEVIERLLTFLFVLALIVGFFGTAFYGRDITRKGKQIKAEKADYVEDITTTDLVYQLNKLATDLDLFVYTMKSTDNYIFDENDLKDFQMYSDFVIYGDEIYPKANILDYKITYMGMMVGVINYRMDKVNTFVYSLGKNRKYYNFLWEDVYKDIEAVNEAIAEYNKQTGYKMSYVESMKEIDVKVGKEEWNKIEGTVYPQGDLE